MPTDENRCLHRETLHSAAAYAELNELLNNMNAWLATHATRLGVSGRSSFTVVSPPNTQVGTFGYVKNCYVNSRGETGPDSTPLQFMVN